MSVSALGKKNRKKLSQNAWQDITQWKNFYRSPVCVEGFGKIAYLEQLFSEHDLRINNDRMEADTSFTMDEVSGDHSVFIFRSKSGMRR